jgi:hypothetical protein
MTRLEIADLEQIVSTLRREHERLTGGHKRSKGGAFQRAAFLALRVVAYSIPITLALLLLGVFLLDWGGSIQAILLFGWLVVALFLLLPLTLINLPLIITAWKQRRPIVNRKLLVLGFPSWQLRARWVVAGLTVAAAILAVILPEHFGWLGFVVFLLIIVFPFLVLMLQSFLGLARRSLALTRSAEELLVVLEEKLAEARHESRQAIELPHELAVKLSDATDGMLASERLRAIDESTLLLPSKYSVAQSGSFRESLKQCEPTVRLQVLDHLQELASNQQPSGARRAETGDHWIWALNDLSMEVVYEVAEDAAKVLVRDVQPLTAAGGGADGSG